MCFRSLVLVSLYGTNALYGNNTNVLYEDKEVIFFKEAEIAFDEEKLNTPFVDEVAVLYEDEKVTSREEGEVVLDEEESTALVLDEVAVLYEDEKVTSREEGEVVLDEEESTALVLDEVAVLYEDEKVASEEAVKQNPIPSPSSPNKRNFYPIPKRIALSHADGPRNLPGYPTNYSTLEILSSPNYVAGKFLPMIDLRGHRFDNTKYAANVGLLGRYIPKEDASFKSILGANIYYDYLQGTFGGFNQLGAGIEVLGERLDFRANVYVPLAVSGYEDVRVFDNYIGDYVITKRRVEFVSYGYNAEVGGLAFRSKDFFFYAAAGIYYLSGKNCNQAMRGGELRIRPQYKDYIALDLSVSYDSIFRTVYQGKIIFSLPLYQISSSKDQKKPRGLTDRQIYQAVERSEIMTQGRCYCWDCNF